MHDEPAPAPMPHVDVALPAEPFLAALLTCAGDAIVGITLDGVITSWSPGAVWLFGYAPDDAIGQSLSLLMPPDRPDALPAHLARLRTGECVEQHETVHVGKDGTRLDISLSMAPVRDGTGTVVGAVSVMHDLTEQHRSARERYALQERVELGEAAQTESEARLRAIWEATSEALAISDPEGIVLDVNPAYCALYGRSAEECIGRSFALILAEDARAEAEAQYREVFASLPAPTAYEARIQQPDGTDLVVEAHADFLVRGDRRVAMVSAIRDITERKRLEQAQLDFVAMASHDLASPLTVLRARAQILQRRQRYDEPSVAAILEQTDRMARLITDLRELVQVESGTLSLHREELDLAETAQAAVTRARTIGPGHTIRIELPDSPVIIWGDRDRLGQVLDNLIGNAVKYSPAGRDIVVRMERTGGDAHVSVTDQGQGIAPDALPHLFGRFVRGAHEAENTGLGLGLYITRMLVEAHGGQITATSQLGQGSVFTVVLPARP